MVSFSSWSVLKIKYSHKLKLEADSDDYAKIQQLKIGDGTLNYTALISQL